MEDVRSILATNLRLARHKAKVSQEELADNAGVDSCSRKFAAPR
jgi:hypothetical protein